MSDFATDHRTDPVQNSPRENRMDTPNSAGGNSRSTENRDENSNRGRGGKSANGRNGKWNGAKKGKWQKQRNRKNPRPSRGPQESREIDEKDLPEPTGPATEEQGLIEISGKGFGFLRLAERNFFAHPKDVFVTPEMVRNLGLRDGLWIKGEARQGHRGPQMTEVFSVNGRKPDSFKTMPVFEDLKAVNPDKRFVLESQPDRLTTRVIDLITPIGRGQRGLIVAPPRSGKTTILQHMAEAMLKSYPDVHVMVVLIDERPEEVTELKRVLSGAEIFASSNDMDTRTHARTATIAIERAKRLVESGDHVFLLLDSITRLARQFNNLAKGGRTGSGGMDTRAMEIPRRLFAAARNTRNAGSLTIIGTALIETNSRMDEVIFQEFKGTGNMELVLDRRIAEQYIFPAVDIFKSGTRREELLLPAYQVEKLHMLRRGLAGIQPAEAIERLIQLMEKYPDNNHMLADLKLKY